jgi:hypothetical protein
MTWTYPSSARRSATATRGCVSPTPSWRRLVALAAAAASGVGSGPSTTNSAAATLILFMFQEYPGLLPVNPRCHLQRLLSKRIFKNYVCLRGEESTPICVLVLRAHHDVRSPGRSASLPSQAKRSLGFGIVDRFLPCSAGGEGRVEVILGSVFIRVVVLADQAGPGSRRP